MRREMRVDMYSDERFTMELRSSSSIDGREPIFEKRDAIVESRLTSLFISLTVSLSTPSPSSSSIQAISDDIGVPSWWAVSFDRPTHTLFCSARLVDETA